MYPIIGIVFFLAALGLGVVSLKGRTMMPGLIFFSFCIGLESLILGLLSPKIGIWQIIATIVVIAATSLAEIRSRKIPRTAFFITLIAVGSILGIALFSAAWVLITLMIVAAIAMFCSPKGSSCGRTRRIILLTLAIATILLVCVLSLMTFTPRQASSTAVATETTAATAMTTAVTATATPEAVVGSWQMAAGDYGENCWFAEGIPEISSAKTDKEARDAAYIWLEGVKKDPTLLAGASLFLLDRWVDKDSLFDENGFATQVAVDLVAELKLLLNQSTITADMAPSKGYNSGVFDETVKSSSKSGITGDRHAIKIVRPDSVTVWIMGRCGNGVTIKKVTPPTTNQTPTPTTTKAPTPTPTTNPTPTPTPTLAPKNPDKDPAAGGKAPDGSNVNQDPGPGNYVAPIETSSPPTESRVNPTPPAPTTSTPTAVTTAAPAATPIPTPVDVAVGDPTSVGTPAIPN